MNYLSIIRKGLNELFFICKGRCLTSKNFNKKIDFHNSPNHCLKIFVYDLKIKESDDKRKKNIICLECENSCILDLNDSQFSIENYVNNH